MTNVIYQQDALGKVTQGTPLQWVHGGIKTAFMQLSIMLLTVATVGLILWREPGFVSEIMIWAIVLWAALAQVLELRCRRVILPVLLCKPDNEEAKEDIEDRERRFIKRLQSSQMHLLILGVVNLLGWMNTVSLWLMYWVVQRSQADDMGVLWGVLILLSVMLLTQALQLFRRCYRLGTLSDERYAVTILPGGRQL